MYLIDGRAELEIDQVSNTDDNQFSELIPPVTVYMHSNSMSKSTWCSNYADFITVILSKLFPKAKHSTRFHDRLLLSLHFVDAIPI